MKYMLLMQFSNAMAADLPPVHTWAPERMRAHIDFMHATNAELQASGEFVQAEGLGGPAMLKIVRATGGAPVVTDGPFAETKEFLAGWWIVDVESEQRALDIAAQVSAAPGPNGEPFGMPIEVHPVMSAPV